MREGFAFGVLRDIDPLHPLIRKKQHVEENSWPLFQILFKEKRIGYLDNLLVMRMLVNDEIKTEECILFFLHLILSAKAGHLCCIVNEKEVLPSVYDLWQNEEGIPLTKDLGEQLKERIKQGASCIKELLSADSLITISDSAFYLQKFWFYETLCIKHFQNILKRAPAIELNIEEVQRKISEMQNKGALLREQAEAILAVCGSSITLITGGPGTGKTYTAGHLIRTFWENLNIDEKKCCQIALAAPTGKAASNLQKSLTKVFDSLEGLPKIEAKTLHALLGISSRNGIEEKRRLAADLVVIDESSMIDVFLMSTLFQSLKEGARLVLLGDPHQLPSVEAGSVFADLVQLSHKISIPSISLSVCMRAELKSLVNFGALINSGKGQKALEQCFDNEQAEIQLIPLEKHPKQFIKRSIAIFHSYLHVQRETPFRILSPLRKGPFGSETINQLIWEKLIDSLPNTGTVTIPIMVTVNDYKQELFNGETGILIRSLPLRSSSYEDYAIFPSRQGDRQERKISAALLPKYELAFCLSVHKSQGSEFDNVILLLPEGSQNFGREMLYTAITRARKSIEIHGTQETFLETVSRKNLRLSQIKERVMNGLFEKQ